MPPGLYVSPNSIHFPEIMRKQGYNSAKCPDPWQHFYARFMREDTLPLFWTAILPRRQVFNGFLSPLNHIDVAYRDSNNRRGWGLEKRQLAEWQNIEQILIRTMMFISSLVLTHLDLDVGSRTVPWPSTYKYDCLFPLRSKAMSAMRSVRAVFMLKIASLSYLMAINSKVTLSWLDTACQKKGLPWMTSTSSNVV
jgi:hypothetical protein